MEITTTKEEEIVTMTVKKSKAGRRKRDVKEIDPVAHVVVTTTPLKPRILKPESKKLRRKLHEYANENESLSKVINDKNIEILSLKKSVDSLNEVLNSVPIDELRCNSSIASTKILELSKKNRQMRAECAQLKNRLSKKDVQIEKLQRELKANEEKCKESVEQIKKGTVDDLQAKIHNLQQRLFESRNKNTELQNQLKLAQKCLQHEIGESVNINTLFSNQTQSTWRGRAQQILSLQQKLLELRQRLELYEERMSDRAEYFTPVALGSDFDLTIPLKSTHSRVHAGNAAGSSESNAVPAATFDRFTPGVRKCEIQHRAKIEGLEKEISELQQQLEEQRSKVLALKVRNKTLNEEMLRYKQRKNELEEQTGYNGINIESMNEKFSKQRQQYENRLEDVRSEMQRITEERDTARRQLEELSNKNLELEAEGRDREMFLKQLQDMVKKLEMDLRAISGGFLFSCREFRKEEFVGILDALEVEKNQLILHNRQLNERLDAEREKQVASSEQVIKQKQRIARLELKIRDLEKDLDTQSERKKRTQRMAEYANSLSRNSINGSVSSFTFENQSIYSSTQTLDQNAESKVEDLKNELDLAKEKIMMLNEKLEHITKEKITDAKFFEDTMINSKAVILNTILEHYSPRGRGGAGGGGDDGNNGGKVNRSDAGGGGGGGHRDDGGKAGRTAGSGDGASIKGVKTINRKRNSMASLPGSQSKDI